jgi:hypothetical protein
MSRLREALDGAVAAWNDFWFEPVSVATLALVRIATGVLVFFWTLSLIPDLRPMYTSTGILPDPPSVIGYEGGTWGLLNWFTSDTAVVVAAVALAVSALLVAFGLVTRLASLALFVLLLSFERRNPWVLNSGDTLLRLLAFYLVLAPTGAAFSVDAWLRAGRRVVAAPQRAIWPLRLMQIQLSIVYLFAVWGKSGVTWHNGTAVSYAMRIGDVTRFGAPDWFTNSELLVNLFTYGTLALELSLAILVWNRRLRPWILLLGITLHLGIDYSIRVGFFSYAMLALYLSFVPPATAERVLSAATSAVGRRVGRLRGRGRPAESSA